MITRAIDRYLDATAHLGIAAQSWYIPCAATCVLAVLTRLLCFTLVPG